MTRTFGLPPGLDEIDTMARAAFQRLPEAFLRHLDGVRILVEDFADEATLRAAGIADPFDLTGIYEGVPVGEKHLALSGVMPDRIRLFRSPILDEWVTRGTEDLEHLVAHVLIHEIGQHFGLSDADMAALEVSSETS
ncbi:MAG: metallopeptidase family protein [Novosphingobium sp.]